MSTQNFRFFIILFLLHHVSLESAEGVTTNAGGLSLLQTAATNFRDAFCRTCAQYPRDISIGLGGVATLGVLCRYNSHIQEGIVRFAAPAAGAGIGYVLSPNRFSGHVGAPIIGGFLGLVLSSSLYGIRRRPRHQVIDGDSQQILAAVNGASENLRILTEKIDRLAAGSVDRSDNSKPVNNVIVGVASQQPNTMIAAIIPSEPSQTDTSQNIQTGSHNQGQNIVEHLSDMPHRHSRPGLISSVIIHIVRTLW